ncbi:MAG: type II toxin-antitoxin system Phd/YefM family antitoxin [Caldilineaceae bacterium]
MVTVAATDLKNKLGQIMDQARREPVLVQSHGRDMVVILDHAEFERLQRLKENQLTNRVETPSTSAALLLSMAGMFNSGNTATSEQVKALVTDFILHKHEQSE